MKNLFTASLLIAIISAQGQPNTWAKKLAFSGNKRERAVGFSIGNYGYICFGQDTAELMHKDLWQYDPTFDTWTQKADFSGVGRRNAIAFVINGKAYAGTGMSHADSYMGNTLMDFAEYDPNSNAWTPKSSFPGGSGNGIYYASGFAVGDKGYICGGKMGPDWYSNELWQYDPGTDQWTQKASFSGGDRYGLSSVTVGNKAYLGLGADHDIYRNDWWEYDPSNNTLTQKAPFPPGGRTTCSTFAIQNRAYVLFGTDGGYKDDLWEYNPVADSWQVRAKFPGGARRNAVAFSIGTTAFAGTGKGNSGCRRNFYQYYPIFPAGQPVYAADEPQVRVFPNPSYGTFYLQAVEKVQQVFLYDLSGRKHELPCKTVGNIQMVNASGFKQGTYDMVLILNGGGKPSLSAQKITIIK